MLPRYVEIVNLGDRPVEVKDFGLAGTSGRVEIPVWKPGDAPSTLPREVWARVWRRHDTLMEPEKARRLGMMGEPGAGSQEAEAGSQEAEAGSQEAEAGSQEAEAGRRETTRARGDRK